MKFGQQFEVYQIDEWKAHYFPYKGFKKRLGQLKTEALKSAVPTPAPEAPLPATLGQAADALEQPPAIAPTAASAVAPALQAVAVAASDDSGAKDAPAQPLLDQLDPVDVWSRDIIVDVERLRDFISNGLQELEDKLKEVSDLGAVIAQQGPEVDIEQIDDRPTMPSSKQPFTSLTTGRSVANRVLEELGCLSEASQQLFDFAELNHVAIYKVYKKFDKNLERGTGAKEMSDVMEKSALMFNDRFQMLHKEIHRLHFLAATALGLERSEETLMQLTSSLQERRGKRENNLAHYYYFLGTSTALLLSLILLLFLPPVEPDTFSMPRLLSAFPLFYAIFWVLFFLWCAGFVVQACDHNKINFRFILAIDPKCKVGSGSILAVAAVLTSAWIVAFGAYVVDYKWGITSVVTVGDEAVRYLPRLAVYPALLCVVLAACIFWPYGANTYTHRFAIVKAICRTALAPLFVVSFADNITGDILTSLVKPLQDMTGAFCYCFASHPHSAMEALRFETTSSVCPEWDSALIDPLIAALPLIFRALQCCRRYHDHPGATKHLANLGKYSTSLLVVIVGATIGGHSTPKIVLAAIATVYSAIWDIKMDWALSWHTLTQPRDESTMVSNVMVPNNQVSRKPVHHPRLFQPTTYMAACIMDVALRLVWVLTLLPIGFFVDGLVNRMIFRAVVSALELARRSLWFILRVEHEQALNGSGFRTLNWVPSARAAGNKETLMHVSLKRRNSVESEKSQFTQFRRGESMRSRAQSKPEVPRFEATIATLAF